ncbi:MAG: threonine--tRNA ligase, partial [Patescibacteria group bacterium]
LPMRIAEYGAVYRYEQSGELHGMMRVRGPIHQNDAHIFCTEEQAGEEFQKVMDLHKYYYGVLGLTEKDYFLSFATKDPKNKSKYAGDEALWEKAEKIALQYIKKTNIPYEIEMGGAAFYGPKIDFNIKTVTGKVFSASTNQLDFFLPKAFNIKYIDKDGKEKTPVCIHRAPLGAHVRFIAFLMEHYAGAFPAWLAPEQVWILPIASRHEEYANKIAQELKEKNIRVIMKNESETVGKKIRAGEQQKIPYILIIGDKEIAATTVAVRQRGKGDLGPVKIEKFIEKIAKEIEEKI